MEVRQQQQLTEETINRRLFVFNSLSRKKDLFIPNKSRTIQWYTCGPTVYDVAHLGHARCYITFDIIRRILSDYFNYKIFYLMNITDIDDKIIIRARGNFLYHQLINKFKTRTFESNIVTYVEDAIKNYKLRFENEQDEAKLQMLKTIVDSSESALKEMKELYEQRPLDDERILSVLEKLRDVISDDQDRYHGHTISDQDIKRETKFLTTQYEQEFYEDMRKLNVLPPSASTRVSDFIEEIGKFIQGLLDKGYAYKASDGSVYFDTIMFDKVPEHRYAKLVREAYQQAENPRESEGELSHIDQGKKSPSDFAVWKRSKPGEPFWTTNGLVAGRPGWHIECSVMASHHLGKNFDLHSGGCDLKFPHHDNEIAQSEAYFDTGENWVNYFLHSGHLTISGCKMSKSLKNFITIRSALEKYSSRQIRFAFLAHGWTDTLDYSDNTMNTAKSYEKTFKEFFFNVADYIRRRMSRLDSTSKSIGARLCNLYQKWSQDDHQIYKIFMETIDKVDIALCDNFDTRSALNHLTDLVKEYNKRVDCDVILVKDFACYVHRILEIFGTNFEEFNINRLFSIESIDVRSNAVDSNEEAKIYKHVETLAKFRADVRKICKSSDAQQSVKDILIACDNLRDCILPNLGVQLEDKDECETPFLLKFVDSETLARERAEKETAKRLKEESARLEKLKLAEDRDKKMKIPPTEMFTSQLDKYSKFDEKGFPTHDATGKEISKSALKKLQRLYAEQELRYSKYCNSLKGDD